MRMVIVATGSWGDVRPNVVLGQALQHAGYPVLLVAVEEFRHWVEGRGLPFVGLSFNIQAVLDAQAGSSNVFETLRWMREVSHTTLQMGREIADVLQDGDVVLVNEGILPLVNGALEKRKARAIHVNLQPWAPSAAFSGMAPARPAWLPVPEPLYNRMGGALVRRSQWWAMGKNGNQLRSEYLGLPKQTWANHRAMLETTPSLLLVSPHVLPRPADWSPQHRVTGYLFDADRDWEAPHDLRDFLANGEPPVYIGFGSMRERNPQQTTHLILEAVRQTGRRAVLLSGWAGIGAVDLPDEVYLLKYAPHDWLFPRMLAVVHHGGAGTTHAALRAGVPSVVVPMLSDQPFWGQRLYQIGAGTQPIPRASLSSEKLAAAITEATTSRVIQQTASSLGAKIATEDSARNAVRAIREFLQ